MRSFSFHEIFFVVDANARLVQRKQVEKNNAGRSMFELWIKHKMQGSVGTEMDHVFSSDPILSHLICNAFPINRVSFENDFAIYLISVMSRTEFLLPHILTLHFLHSL